MVACAVGGDRRELTNIHFLPRATSPRTIPDPGEDGLQAGAKRKYQTLSPLDFLAEFAHQIPARIVSNF